MVADRRPASRHRRHLEAADRDVVALPIGVGKTDRSGGELQRRHLGEPAIDLVAIRVVITEQDMRSRHVVQLRRDGLQELASSGPPMCVLATLMVSPFASRTRLNWATRASGATFRRRPNGIRT